MLKKTTCLFLMITMLACLFAGCGSSAADPISSAASEEQTEAAASAAHAETEEAAPTAEAEAVESAAEEASTVEEPAEERTVITYPVTEEEETFTMCYAVFGVINMMLENGYTDAPIYQALADATGVKFEVEQMDTQTYQEKLQLMVVSDTLPDLVNGMLQIYTNGASQALDEETVLDIAPYLDDYAPDYKAAIEAYDGGMAALTTDDGRMAAMYEIYSTDNSYTSGYFIRDDMLEATGLGVPETVDDLIELGKAMYSNGVQYPIYVNSDGDDTGLLIDLWFHDWGYMDWYWDTETQTVEYSHVQDYNYDYMEWLRDAWQSGAFLSSGASDALGMTTSFNDLFKTNAVAIFTGKDSTIDEELSSLDTETSVTALPDFNGSCTDQGERPEITGNNNACISANCEDPETLLMALNYLYTEDGAFLANYGIEGQAYELEDGSPRFTDIVMNNPNVAMRFAKAYYTDPVFPCLTDPHAMSYSWSTYAQDAQSIWSSAYTGYEATFDESLITLTDDEQDVINKYMSDLDTYCTETLYSFVYGDTALTEASFKTFTDTCYNTLGLQEILDIYTDAWLRYLSK